MIKRLIRLGVKKSSLFFPLLFLLCSSCYRISQEIEPQINYTIQARYLKELPSAFAPLTQEEKASDWGKEYLIGMHFAKGLDLYRAITAFRRAQILAPSFLHERRAEMDYAILLSYYLGKRFDDLDSAFLESSLKNAGPEFPAFHELLVLLYDTYIKLNNTQKACHILQLIQHHFPQTYESLLLSSALIEADFSTLRNVSPSNEYPYITALLNTYDRQKKSPRTAALLNAFIPGTGYFYVGERQTGVTALLVNGLFIAASVQFFLKGYIAAGIITTSFEAGWYFGGIYGAANQAKFYNERLYEKTASPMMNHHHLFPVFMLKYAF